MASSMPESIEILIMGKTGNGKSATGNSILGRDAFVTSADAVPTLWYTQNAHTRYGDQTVRVVEAPGMCQTARGEGGNKKEVSREFAQVFFLCRRGIDAMLMAIRFGERFTQEDLRVPRTIKRVFGEDFLRKRCILVFTHGELFDMEFKGNESFDTWIEDQQGHLKQLIKECDYRCVLFRNRTDEAKECQKEELFALINEIKEKEGGRHDFMDGINKKAASTKTKLQPTNVPSQPTELQESIGLLQDSLITARQHLQKSKKQDDDVPEQVVKHINWDIDSVRLRAENKEGIKDVSSPRNLNSLPRSLKKMQDDMANEKLRHHKKDFEQLLASHIEQCGKWMEGLVEMNKRVSKQMELISDLLLQTKVLDNRRDSQSSLNEL